MGTAKNKRPDAGEASSPGKITVDSRGRNIWQWNDDQLDSTTIMLQRLDNASLELESTRSVRKPGLKSDKASKRRAEADRRNSNADDSGSIAIEATMSVKLGGGFDPYNSG